ncbi:MAG TPA: hypothetical protein VLA82_05925 [Actinomycetota bacterium]|nr:hypothetical protein [Actinomycetota bacterium]
MGRRFGVAVIVVAGVTLTSACSAIGDNREPWCRPVPATRLLAQSVRSASLVPCVTELPAGWAFDGFAAADTGATFALVGPDEPASTAAVTFADACPDARGRPLRSDEDGTELLEEVRGRSPYAATWTYRFDGGCARVDVELAAGTGVDEVTRDLARAMSFVPRTTLT